MALVKRLGHLRVFALLASKIAPPLDRAAYRRTGHTLLTPRALPTVLLTTTGRRSGRPRSVPVFGVFDEGRLMVAGTNWGKRREPNWALNLAANPLARVQMGETSRQYRARPATDREREQLWPKLEEIWPAYRTYRRRSGREVSVFVLEP